MASRARFTLTVTVARTGETWTTTVAHMPRHWKSYVMLMIPYGTDVNGGLTFSRSRA